MVVFIFRYKKRLVTKIFTKNTIYTIMVRSEKSVFFCKKLINIFANGQK